MGDLVSLFVRSSNKIGAMSRPFLTAQWRNLILANFPVAERQLVPLLPNGIEPDRFEGQCWVSLVGFQFRRTRVFGIGWPGFRDFPEWNLRAYVRRGERRGVIFVREFVQSRFIARVARSVYNEPYLAAPIKENVTQSRASYRVERGDRWHELYAEISGRAFKPTRGSAAEFFTEQSWGFGLTRRGKPMQYAVKHPTWPIETVQNFRIDVDWEKLYGPHWTAMNDRAPANVLYAAGSEVAVFPANRRL